MKPSHRAFKLICWLVSDPDVDTSACATAAVKSELRKLLFGEGNAARARERLIDYTKIPAEGWEDLANKLELKPESLETRQNSKKSI